MSKKSLFDDAPEPIFKEGQEPQEHSPPVDNTSLVPTEDMVAVPDNDQPDIPEIPDDESFEDIGQQQTTTVTFGTPTVNNAAGTISYPVTFSNVGSGLTGSDFRSILAFNPGSTVTMFGGGISGSGSNWVLTYVNTGRTQGLQTTYPATSGTITASINADAFTDRIITGGRTGQSASFNIPEGTTVSFAGRTPGTYLQPQVNNVNRTVRFRVNIRNFGSGLNVNSFTINDSRNGAWSRSLRVNPDPVSEGSSGSAFLTITSTEAIRANGTVSITVNQDAFTNRRVLGGNQARSPGTGRRSANASYAFAAPSDISFSSPVINNDTRTITYTITFGDPGSGLTVNDFTINDSRDGTWLRTLSGTGNIRTLVLTNTEHVVASGRLSVTIARDAFTDRALTGPVLSGTATYNFQQFVSWGTPIFCETSATNGRVTANLTFGRPVTGLTAGDITFVASGTWTSITITQQGSTNTYTVTADAPSSVATNFYFILNRNSVNYTATQTGPISNEQSPTIFIDNRPAEDLPSITIDNGSYNTSTRKISWNAYITNASISEIVSLDSSDITLNGAPSGVGIESVTRTPAYGSSYRIVTQAVGVNDTGNASITIRTNALGSNTNRAVTSGCVNYGAGIILTPFITIGFGSFCPTSRKLTWSVFVTNATPEEFAALDADDITINDSLAASPPLSETIVNRATNSLVVEIIVPANRMGNASITIAANALGLNTNTAITSGQVDYDTRAVTTPTVATATWGTPAAQTGVNAVLQGRITFGGTIPITGIEPGDFDVIVSTPQGNVVHPEASWTLQVSHNDVTAARRYIDVTAIPNGTFVASFGLRLRITSVKSDGSTTDNAPAANIDSTTVAFSNRVAIAEEPLVATWSNMTGGPQISGQLTFGNRDVSGISAADFELRTILGREIRTTITVSATAATAGQTITVTAAPRGTLKVDGQYFLRLKQDSLTVGTGTGPDSNVDSNLVELNTFTVWGDPTGGTTISAELTFGTHIVNIATSDFEVIDDTDVVQSGWTIALNPNTASRTNGQTLTVTATPPVNTADIYRIRLKAASLRVSGSSRDTVPVVAAITKRARVNNIEVAPQDVIATWSNLTGGPTISGTLTFGGQDVSDISASDFELRTILGRATAVTITVSATSASAGQSITVTATPSATYKIDGELFLRLKQDSLTVGTGTGPNEHIDSNLVELNTFTIWGDPTGGTTLSATMTFGSDLIRIAAADFDVIDQANETQSGWTIALSPDVTIRNVDETLLVTATPPANTADLFRLRLNSQTLRTASGSTDTVPKVAVVTKPARVNNLTSTEITTQVIIGVGTFDTDTDKLTWPISVVNADAMQFLSLDAADITITDTTTTMPALTATIANRGTNSLDVEITVPSDRQGTASITVAANALGPSTNAEVTSNDVAYDTRTGLASTTVTYGTPVPDNPGRDIEFPVTFSDIGEGLTGDDFSVVADNGIWGVTIRDGTGGPQTKVIVVTNTEPYARMGNLTITLDANAFTDRTIDGPRVSPSAAYNFTSTITATTVTYGTPDIDNDNRTIRFIATFTNIGAGLTTDDWTITDSNNSTWVLSMEHLGNNQVAITVVNTLNTTLAGNLSITIAQDAFFNRTLPDSIASRRSGNAAYAFNQSALPVVTITTHTTARIRYGQQFTVFFTWNRDVTGFTADDINITPRPRQFGSGAAEAQENTFSGSGRQYQITITAPTNPNRSDGYIYISVPNTAVTGGNVPAFHRVPLGNAAVDPTILSTNQIAGDGLAYTKDAIWTIGQDEADTTARLRSYNESAVLQTNNLVTVGAAIDLGQDRHARSIDILDNRFLISARYFGTFGIARAAGYTQDSRTFNKLFIDSGDYVNSFEVIHSIEDPIEDARLRNHPDPEARVGNEQVLARIPARAIQRRNEFVTRQFTTHRVATDTAVQAIAVGPNRIYLLTSGGSVSEPEYDIQIYDLFGQLVTNFSVDTNTENTKEFGAVPASLAATSRFLYLGFTSFEDPLRGRTDNAPDLYAYTLDGERWPAEDIPITFPSPSVSDWYYGIQSMDWDETRERMWMIVRRVRHLDQVTEQYLGYFGLPQPVDPKWSAIEPQTLEAGDTLDIKPYAGNISSILTAPGTELPTWATLSNGVITIASSGLPSANTTVRLSFIGIGSGRPAYVSFELTLLREAPTWRTI